LSNVELIKFCLSLKKRYEIGYGFIDAGKAFINVEKTTTIVFNVVNYDLTKENFLDLAVGDEDDWQELVFED